MINSIIQTIIENKEFLEKSITASEISMFSRDLRKVFDEAGRKTLVRILEMIDTLLFEDSRRKIEYETKDLRQRTLVTQYGNIEYIRRYYRNRRTKKYIYLADENHVSERGNKIGMPKLIYVHEGNYTKGKRNILKNVHYIGRLGKSREDLWLEVAEYIDKTKDEKKK